MYSILVVDDNIQNVKFLELILKKEGYNVFTALNGEDGLTISRNEKPDLILLDIMLPGMTGLDVLEILKKDEQTLNIPVIIVTAKVSPEEAKQGLQAGAFDYIKKPFERVEIIARIRSALRFRDAQLAIIESEKLSIYAATVVTANHKIKQPLTVIKLAISALRRELGKPEFSRQSYEKRIDYIESAVEEVNDILNQLKEIQRPQISNYVRDIKMIDIDTPPEHGEKAE